MILILFIFLFSRVGVTIYRNTWETFVTTSQQQRNQALALQSQGEGK